MKRESAAKDAALARAAELARRLAEFGRESGSPSGVPADPADRPEDGGPAVDIADLLLIVTIRMTS